MPMKEKQSNLIEVKLFSQNMITNAIVLHLELKASYTINCRMIPRPYMGPNQFNQHRAQRNFAAGPYVSHDVRHQSNNWYICQWCSLFVVIIDYGGVILEWFRESVVWIAARIHSIHVNFAPLIWTNLIHEQLLASRRVFSADMFYVW